MKKLTQFSDDLAYKNETACSFLLYLGGFYRDGRKTR